MSSQPSILLRRALLVRPQNSRGNPGDTLQLLLFPKSGVAIPTDLYIDLTFAENMGSETWKESAREYFMGGLCITLTPANPNHVLARALLQSGRFPECISHLALRYDGNTVIRLARDANGIEFRQEETHLA